MYKCILCTRYYYAHLLTPGLETVKSNYIVNVIIFYRVNDYYMGWGSVIPQPGPGGASRSWVFLSGPRGLENTQGVVWGGNVLFLDIDDIVKVNLPVEKKKDNIFILFISAAPATLKFTTQHYTRCRYRSIFHWHCTIRGTRHSSVKLL